MMLPGEKQVNHEATVDDAQTMQSKDDAEVFSGLSALNDTAKHSKSDLLYFVL